MSLVVLLEPQDRRTEQPALAQVVTHPRFDGAQVFAHHHRTGAVGLQRNDADHRLVVVAHVGALRGRRTLRYPPQPEQADDVVDAHPTRVPQHRGHQRTERLVGRLRQPVGPPWRLRPVLTELIELVGWGTRRHSERQHVLQRPGVSAVGIDADGEVGHDAQRHPRLHGRALRGAELLVDDELQPAVEVHLRLMLHGEAGHRLAARVLQLGGPLMPVRAVVFGQGAPGGEVVEAATLPSPERGVGDLTAGRELDEVDALQRRALGLPGAVTVDLLGARGTGLHLLPGFPDPTPVTQQGVLGNRLDPHIYRVDEPARRRQIGRGFHGRGRGGRVHRVDQHETGAVLGGRPHRQVGEVGQIADSPGVLGADAVELGGQAPGAAAAEPGRHIQLGGRDDDRRADVGGTDLHVQVVVADRHIRGQLEGGLADRAAVEVERRPVVLQLPQTGAHAAVLQAHPQPDRITVGDVHPERCRHAVAPDDRRRQRPRPVLPVVSGQGGGPVLLGGGGHTQRLEDGDQRGRAGADPPAGPVLVVRRHPVTLGEVDQRGGRLRRHFGCHAANLACRCASEPNIPAQ